MKKRVLRRPPAYQEYAADLMAREELKLMPLAEVGLLVKMRWYAWSNDTLPEGAASLARVLGLPEPEVRKYLTPAVLSFFASAKGAAGRIQCPELTGQMENLMQRRIAQSKAADATNAKRKAA